MVKDLKKAMMEYEMTDLGLMKYFLGMQVKQSPGEIFISQEKSADDILKKFNIVQHDKFLLTQGQIWYKLLVWFQDLSEPCKAHFAAAKRILRYLKGTKNYGLLYRSEEDNKLVGFTDSDWAGCVDDRKSTSGYLFSLGTKAFSWSSRKQKTVALSSAEAEYVAATSAACEAIWLKRILADMQLQEDESTVLYCDNISAIALIKNPVFHSRTKHIEIRHHFIRELVEDGELKILHCQTGEQIADVFTKPLPAYKFNYI
ncbi:hypothetical protein AgCh_036989 [Apium graveolens]